MNVSRGKKIQIHSSNVNTLVLPPPNLEVTIIVWGGTFYIVL